MRGSVVALLARTSRAAWPLLVLGAVVVALVCALGAVVPRMQADAATASVRAAAADPDAVVSVAVPLTGDDAVPRPLVTSTADTVRYVADKVALALPEAYGPPVAVLLSRPIAAGRVDDRNAEMRLALLGGDGAPRVTWTEGRSPRATASAIDVVGSDGDAPPVEVGLTAATAGAMGLAVGDEIQLGGPDTLPVTVRVTGLFAPVDTTSPDAAFAWSLVPSLLEPLVVDGSDRRIAVVALLNDESAPFARYALPSQSFDARYVSRPDPTTLTLASARQLASDVRALTAAPDGVDVPGIRSTVTTRADVVIQRSLDLGAAATARAATVLLGLLAAAGALLALAAGVLAERRRTTLALARTRGASRVVLAGLATAEAAVVALGGAGIAAVVVGAAGAGGAGGSVASIASTAPVWAPILLAAVLLPPIAVLAAVSAGETPPTGPGRARSRRARLAARAAVEVVVVALAVLAVVTLRARGDAASAGSVTADLVVLAAAPLIALACVVITLRAALWLRRGALALARRSDGAVALLAAARGGPGPVATTAVVVSVAMAVLAAASPVPPRTSDDGAQDPVAAPFADAAGLTRTSVVAALVAVALVAVVLVGVADRARRDADDARARALGLPASRATRVAVLAAAVPVAVAAAVGVAAGLLTVALVLPAGAGDGTAGAAGAVWWAAVPTLAAVAALVAVARPSRRSLASRLRAA